MKKFAILFIICALAYACKSQQPLVQTVIEYRDRVERDTVTRTDSVYVARYIREKGDTVFVIDTLFKFKYLDKVRDVYVHDSVPYEVQIQVPVRVRNTYDIFTARGFWALLAIVLAFVGWKIAKIYFRIQSGGVLKL